MIKIKKSKTILTKSAKKTQKLAESMAKEIAESKTRLKSAFIIALEGNLGAGKTTFLQGFAKGLKIKEKITSPTFVILKHFKITKNRKPALPAGRLKTKNNFTDFYHIDCYRIQKSKEIIDLGFKEIISNPGNIVAVEWPERIKKIISKNSIEIKFEFINEEQRKIWIKKD